MVVGKQGQQAQHSDNFEVKLVRPVRHPLRQSVQMQIQIANSQNGGDQEDSDSDHQDIGVTGSRDEAWQMMGCGWMKGFAHATLHSEQTKRCAEWKDPIGRQASRFVIVA
jgi:hypothetical protein